MIMPVHRFTRVIFPRGVFVPPHRHLLNFHITSGVVYMYACMLELPHHFVKKNGRERQKALYLADSSDLCPK